MDLETIKALIRSKGFSIESEKRIGDGKGYGYALKIDNGCIVNCYDKGTYYCQGKNTKEIENLLKNHTATPPQKIFPKEPKDDKPIILAICYDFDKTLAPDDMQSQGYIQSVGYDVDAFWEKSNSLAKDNKMDRNLAYMYMMLQEAEGKVLFTKEKLNEYGSKIKLFNGVEKWFERICAYGEKRHVEVEHYIISSGLKEMIEGTPVARYFKAIYASSFYYNERGVAVWPTQVVNYTNKTQYLFRIEKGVLDVNDQAVNDFFPPDELRIPFRNIIYIGDSDTDIPCMSLVNKRGGHAIGVYTDDKGKVFKMMRDGRIKYFVKADYTEGFELDTLVKQIIDGTFANEMLERKHYSSLEECNATGET